MAEHVRAMLAFQRGGAVTFDYGNNIRALAKEAGVENAFDFPGFVPAFIRPLFCEGRGPFRVAALSGDPADIARIDRALSELFPDDAASSAGCDWPPRRCRSRGCRRASAGSATASARAPALPSTTSWRRARSARRSSSAATTSTRDRWPRPYRETEAMRDGSDAIADWPILNALVNTAAGATWVSFHHGGGVGIGYSLHAGMVVVADGTPEAAARLERVLTSDPGMGVIRHADAGYERALEVARERGVRIPMRPRRPDRWTGSRCSSSSRTSRWHSRWSPACSAGGSFSPAPPRSDDVERAHLLADAASPFERIVQVISPVVVIVGLGHGLGAGLRLARADDRLDAPDRAAHHPDPRVHPDDLPATRPSLRGGDGRRPGAGEVTPGLRAAWADPAVAMARRYELGGDRDHRRAHGAQALLSISRAPPHAACPTMRPCDAT